MASSSLVKELEDQFAQNPRRVFARLANEYRKSGEIDRAIEICRAHVPQQPGYISGYIVLGQALYESKQLEESRQTFETALTLDPENLIALRQLGDIARDQRDLDQARAWYRRLLEVDPQNEEVAQQLDELFTSSPPTAVPATAGTGAEDALQNADTEEFFSFGEGAGSDAAESPPAVVLPFRPAPASAGEPAGRMVELPPPPAPAPVPEAAAPSAPAAPSFVTETMAELYLKQGFRDRALDIYRQLRQQSPENEALQERILRLEAEKSVPKAKSAESRSAGDPDSARDNGKETIRDFFAALTTRRHTPATRKAVVEGESPHEWAVPQERVDAGAGSGTRDGARSGGVLQAAAVSPHDEAAARALANAFVDEPDRSVPSSAPPAGSDPTPAQGEREHISFDDFFAQPASPDTGSADRDSSEAPDEGSASDLASFHAWLAGLKK